VLAAGIDVLEITMTVPNAVDLLRQLSAELGHQVLLGAGTVLDAQTARACIDAGAQFIVAPGFDVETLRAAHALDKPCMPGVLTPTEVITARKAGADMVKIFPCSAMGGASYLRALKAPLPQVKMFPTGGVDATTAADFIKAGAAALGVGAAVVDLKLLEQSGPEAVTEKCRELVAVVRAARGLG
jgi:2-dehydro-3-deoxyphosphogluconate aldolase / (4S)-4-hydroxy-2-oxoglutarate aldolase